ncbi:MAG: hypothetical protein ACYCXY_05405 [Acidimicrobiales bacterium]
MLRGMLLGGLVVAASAAEGGLRFSSAAAHASVGAAIVAVATLAALAGRARRHSARTEAVASVAASTHRVASRSRLGTGVVVWLLLIGAAVGLDVASTLEGSRELPTLSVLVGHASRPPSGRAVLSGVWLAGGGWLALARHRAPARRDACSADNDRGAAR